MLRTSTATVVVGGRAVPDGAVWFSKPDLIDLSTYRGDSGRLRVTVTDPDGLPLDVTSATWGCHVRPTLESPELVCELDVELVVGEVSQVDVVLTPDKSILLLDENVWDLEMSWGGGEVNTLFAGNFYAVGDVTRPVEP